MHSRDYYNQPDLDDINYTLPSINLENMYEPILNGPYLGYAEFRDRRELSEAVLSGAVYRSGDPGFDPFERTSTIPGTEDLPDLSHLTPGDYKFCKGMQVTIDDVTMQAPKWHNTGVLEGKDGSQLSTGTIGAMTYVIDPRTMRPVTPGFHEIQGHDNEQIIATTGSTIYRVAAAEPEKAYSQYLLHDTNTADPSLAAPMFLHAPMLEITTLDPKAVKSDWEDRQVEAVFGLAKAEIPPSQKIARTIFKGLEATIVALASKRADVAAQIIGEETMIGLPKVSVDEVQGRMSISTRSDGSEVISIIDMAEGMDKQRGFHLVRNSDGSIVVVDSGLSIIVTSEDPAFYKSISLIDQTAKSYLEALGATTSFAYLEDGALLTLREKLQGLEPKQAARFLRKQHNLFPYVER